MKVMNKEQTELPTLIISNTIDAMNIKSSCISSFSRMSCKQK